MISRRNIRVKVMQTLYTIVSTTDPNDTEKNKKAGSGLLDKQLAHSIDLFTISILYVFRAAQYAEIDAAHRSGKYLPTQEDLDVNTKIASNEFMLKVMANESFRKKVEDAHLEQFVDAEWVKKIYQQLCKSDEYLAYISTPERSTASEKGILHYIWDNLILSNEALQEHFSEELPGWEDDKEMTVLLMENFFKNNSKINFLVPVSDDKHEYAHSLMRTVIDKEEYCMSLVQPKLNNWDTERIALIDLLLLRMGICELLFFPTIPTKVTINEYIEIAKLYSTPQSGQFVNGVLDNILKDLVKENKINKEERTRKS